MPAHHPTAPARIRSAQPTDIDAITDFNMKLARESEAKSLDVDTLRRGVARALASPDLCRYFIAEADGHPKSS